MIYRLQIVSRNLAFASQVHQAARIAAMSTKSFSLDSPHDSVSVTLPQSSDLSKTEIFGFPAFKTWLNTLTKSLSLQRQDASHPFHSDPYSLKSLEIQSVDRFGGKRLGFLKLKADVQNSAGEAIPGSIFLRGGAVAMLVILRVEGAESEKYVLMTKQPRVPAGSLDFLELPAGMIDDSGTFGGAAAKEIEEELGLKIPEDELLDLTVLAAEVGDAKERRDGMGKKEELQRAVYTSPGGSDEFIAVFLHEKQVAKEEIEEWRGKLTGLRDEGEKITLKVVRLEDLWWEGRSDAKALSALALYDGLSRAGKIPKT